MGIKQYEEKGQVYWQAYVHVRSKGLSKKRIQKYAYRLKSEVEARREERKLLQLASREIEKLDGKGLDWGELIRLWEMEIKAGNLSTLGQRSIYDYIGVINKWTRPWVKRPACDLSKADGRELILKMKASGLSKTYMVKIKNLINKVYEWGVEYRYILSNHIGPMKGLLIEKTEEKVPDILTLEEIKKFLRAAQATNSRWYPIWTFAVLTGMRSGELNALTWAQIDLEKNIILVDRSYDANLKKVGPTKGRYWRTIPISNSLRKLILDLKTVSRDVDKAEYVLPRLREWNSGDQANVLRNFLKSVGIKPIRFHALRACFATQMLASGVPAPIVMRIGGWRQTSTMDIYLRLAGVDVKGATDCLNFVPEEINFDANVINLNDWR